MNDLSGVVRPLLVAATLLAAACGSNNPNNVEVKAADGKLEAIARHKTYSRADAKEAPSTYVKGELTPEVLDAVGAVVDEALTQKGYVAADEKAELFVRISAGTRDVKSAMGSAGRAGAGQQTDTQRGIVVDIFDRASNEQLFHGYALYEADPEVVDQSKIRAAVTSTLSTVPRSSAR
jgi:hypothetical protein